MTSGKRKWEDGTFVAGQQFEYEFDGIGNRKVAKNGGVESGSSSGLRSFAYHPNALNQYSSRTVPGSYDVIGIASSEATVTVNGSTAYEKGEYFQKSVSVSNANTPLYSTVSVSATEGGVSSGPTGGKVFVPGTPESFSYDDDGNLKQDGRWDYTWNAENRLTKMESRSGAPAGSMRRLEFKYDAYGRRIWKKETNLDTSAVISERKYIYDGWNLLAELNASNGLEQHYVWGTDLSGTLQGAGGVGGLLAVRASSTSVAHFVGYDGWGNVTGLVDGNSGLWSAQYEYGPFGEAIRETGPMAEANPFRWSTKFTDGTSGMVYYGYRFYNRSIGRWVSRDPIGEDGGENIYALLGNETITRIDMLGLKQCEVVIFEGHNYDVFPEIKKFADEAEKCYAVGALSCFAKTWAEDLKNDRLREQKKLTFFLDGMTDKFITPKDGELKYGGDRSYASSTSVAHFVGYDGGGNVTGLVDGSSGLWSAQYEYGPFGEAIRETGAMAEANPFRWSTKFTDGTSALVYYGYRYYNPGTGRWLNRDPIGEYGGLNLNAFVANRPTRFIDTGGRFLGDLIDLWSEYSGPTFLGPEPDAEPQYVRTMLMVTTLAQVRSTFSFAPTTRSAPSTR